jgi:hypothetical protein
MLFRGLALRGSFDKARPLAHLFRDIFQCALGLPFDRREFVPGAFQRLSDISRPMNFTSKLWYMGDN